VQAATGVIAGMFLQPSTSGLVVLVTVAFSVRALPRQSFVGGAALLALGVAVGLAAMILTSATPARC
jgi:hypothetical protein